MVTLLLTACDPCGFAELGGPAGLYVGFATTVARWLHRGAGREEILRVFPPDVPAARAIQFADAAIVWFTNERRSRELSATGTAPVLAA